MTADVWKHLQWISNMMSSEGAGGSSPCYSMSKAVASPVTHVLNRLWKGPSLSSEWKWEFCASFKKMAQIIDSSFASFLFVRSHRQRDIKQNQLALLTHLRRCRGADYLEAPSARFPKSASAFKSTMFSPDEV